LKVLDYPLFALAATLNCKNGLFGPALHFSSSYFLLLPETVKLAVIATATRMLTITVTETGTVKQGAFYSKKIMVVCAIVFHQQCPTILSNPGLLTTKCLLPKISPEAAD
jgi:hypothetical protein